MYRVIAQFTDLKDDNHRYLPGDKYPRAGAKPTKERIAELMGDENRRGCPLIEEVKEKKTSKKQEDDDK